MLCPTVNAAPGTGWPSIAIGSSGNDNSSGGSQNNDSSASTGGVAGDATGPSKSPGSGGQAANAVGAAREQRVAEVVGGQRSGELIRTSRGKTDIDVVDSAGNIYAVGGAAKAKDLGSFVQSLMIYSETANTRGVSAYFYYAEGTPKSVIDAATKVLGSGFVKKIP